MGKSEKIRKNAAALDLAGARRRSAPPAVEMRKQVAELLHTHQRTGQVDSLNARPLLNDQERAELIRLIETGQPLPGHWRGRLFPDASTPRIETAKEYRLSYAGKMKREEVLATTPAAPWQLVRTFCEDRPHADGWKNLLVWGDKDV